MSGPAPGRGGGAGRASLRSAAGWRAFDRANLALAALLACVALVWWWRAPGPRVPTAPITSDVRVRMRLAESALEFRRDGDQVVLRGQVRSAAARQRLHEAATRQFGDARVQDQLVVDARGDALSWSDRADLLFAELKRGHSGDAVRVLGHAITLTGQARAVDQRSATERRVREGFGAAFVVDNLIDEPGTDAAPQDRGSHGPSPGTAPGTAHGRAHGPQSR